MEILPNWMLKSSGENLDNLNDTTDWDEDGTDLSPFSQEEMNNIVEKALHPLNGMTRTSAVSFVNRILSRLSKGIFRDDSWVPVHSMFRTMKQTGIDVTLLEAKYHHDSQGRPNAKEWKFEIDFKNHKRKDSKLHGIIRAAGAGSVKDPLSAYDLVAYVS